MTAGPTPSPTETTEDLLLALRHLHPAVTDLLALLRGSEEEAAGQVQDLSQEMGRIATALETVGKHLARLPERVAAQEKTLSALRDQVEELARSQAEEARARAALLEEIRALRALFAE